MSSLELALDYLRAKRGIGYFLVIALLTTVIHRDPTNENQTPFAGTASE